MMMTRGKMIPRMKKSEERALSEIDKSEERALSEIDKWEKREIAAIRRRAINVVLWGVAVVAAAIVLEILVKTLIRLVV